MMDKWMPTFESLHGLAQLVYGIAGIPGQVPHRVLDVFLPSGALTSGLARRRLGCRLAAHQLGVELLDGALMAHDGLLLLQDGLPEVDDRVPQLVLHGAAALDTVSRGAKPAARLCARGNGVTHEAATCSILASHRASTEKLSASNCTSSQRNTLSQAFPWLQVLKSEGPFEVLAIDEDGLLPLFATATGETSAVPQPLWADSRGWRLFAGDKTCWRTERHEIRTSRDPGTLNEDRRPGTDDEPRLNGPGCALDLNCDARRQPTAGADLAIRKKEAAFLEREREEIENKRGEDGAEREGTGGEEAGGRLPGCATASRHATAVAGGGSSGRSARHCEPTGTERARESGCHMERERE
ncbi:hypothetical protein EYF80_020436 [Liparis tanakae]|uniref:Uncharacterized protein n=1 Tax=Liparis tanakae TaxID=230148 RepID=A0A4Z2HVG4_9TELE|nr:hypothetical protein EYF80_020436 [Liparis tanakae]